MSSRWTAAAKVQKRCLTCSIAKSSIESLCQCPTLVNRGPEPEQEPEPEQWPEPEPGPGPEPEPEPGPGPDPEPEPGPGKSQSQNQFGWAVLGWAWLG